MVAAFARKGRLPPEVFASQFSTNFVDSARNAKLVGKFGNVLLEAKIAELLLVSVEEIECGMLMIVSDPQQQKQRLLRRFMIYSVCCVKVGLNFTSFSATVKPWCYRYQKKIVESMLQTKY